MKKYLNCLVLLSMFAGNILANSQNVSELSIPVKSLQDSSKAQEFFANELNFTTNAYGVHSAIKEKKDIVIIDVRYKKDYDKGHIPGAINIPADKYKNFTGDEVEFNELKKDTMYYVYCYDLLCNLATKACLKFASLGYSVKEVKGGFEAWKENKYQIVK